MRLPLLFLKLLHAPSLALIGRCFILGNGQVGGGVLRGSISFLFGFFLVLSVDVLFLVGSKRFCVLSVVVFFKQGGCSSFESFLVDSVVVCLSVFVLLVSACCGRFCP